MGNKFIAKFLSHFFCSHTQQCFRRAAEGNGNLWVLFGTLFLVSSATNDCNKNGYKLNGIEGGKVQLGEWDDKCGSSNKYLRTGIGKLMKINVIFLHSSSHVNHRLQYHYFCAVPQCMFKHYEEMASNCWWGVNSLLSS